MRVKGACAALVPATEAVATKEVAGNHRTPVDGLCRLQLMLR
jgi:hypothetical protein